MTGAFFARQRRQTFVAGALATGAMMAVARGVRSPVMSDLHDLAATMTAPPQSVVGETVGYVAQLVSGGLFAQLYDATFETLSIRPGWRAGAGLGVIHGFVAGLFLGAVPLLHPRVPSEVPPPGTFLRHRGWRAAATLVALHGLFGAIVGPAVAATRRCQSDDMPS